MTKQNTIDKSLMIIIIFASVKLLIHLLTNGFASYGVFRDELYYAACSNHLSIGYVDHPPFSIYILALSRLIFGNSLFALRLVPAFAGAFTVYFTGLITKKMGGGLTAVTIACASAVLAPIMLAYCTIYSMNSLDMLLWAIAAYILISIIDENSPRLWLLLGLVIGIGLLNKIGMAWFAVGLVPAVLLTSLRKNLKTIYPYLTAIIAFLVFLPFIIWNITHDFAHLEFIRNATQYKYSGVSRWDFATGQIIMMMPISAIVATAGLWYYFADRDGRKYMPLGIIFAASFLILFINGHSKPEYLTASYPIVFSAGAILIEKLALKKYLKWLKYAVPALIVIVTIPLSPFFLPLLPPESFIKYSKQLGITESSVEGHELEGLPQFYADMFGWENMAKTISDVYKTLPEEEKKFTIAATHNYGEAGCVDYFRSKYELPPVIAQHNSYWYWGKDQLDKDYRTFITYGGDEEEYLSIFEEVEQVAVIKSKYAIPYENNLPVFICRKLKIPLTEIWEENRIFI